MRTLLQRPPHLCFELIDVLGHDGHGAVGVLAPDGVEELAVLDDGVLQVRDGRQGEEPDAQGVGVVAVEVAREVGVVRAAVDALVDALVELDEVAGVDLGAERVDCREEG